MKRYILKLLKRSFLLLIIVSPYFYISYKLKDGNLIYNKFNSKGENIIVGLSRASFAIIPEILSDSLKEISPYKFKNIAIAGSISSYSKSYCTFCKNQIKTPKNDHIFILSISPSAFKKEKHEYNHYIYKYSTPSIISTIDILYHFDLKKALLEYNSTKYTSYSQYGHAYKNSYKPYNEKKSIQRLVETIKSIEISEKKVENFNSLISHLKKYGKVYIIRVPVRKTTRELEQKYMEDFDQLITEICSKHKVNYINLFHKEYQTHDFNHMTTKGARAFTQQLIHDIKEYSTIPQPQASHQ